MDVSIINVTESSKDIRAGIESKARPLRPLLQKVAEKAAKNRRTTLERVTSLGRTIAGLSRMIETISGQLIGLSKQSKEQ